MPECNECGRRFEAARSSKKYCSSACKQSAYLRRTKNDGNDRDGNDDNASVTELADPFFRGDFYGNIGPLGETEVYELTPLSITDDNRDANDGKYDDKPVTVNDGNDGNIVTISDAKPNLTMVSSYRQTSSPSHYNYTPSSKHRYDDSRSLSERKQRFLMKAGNTTHKTESGKHGDSREVKQKQNGLLPVVIEKPHENQITRLMQPDDDGAHYQWIVPDFFNQLNDEAVNRKSNVDWFAGRANSYCVSKVTHQWLAIVCQIVSLSWKDETLLTECRPIYEAFEELVDSYSFNEIRYHYPYSERIKRTHSSFQKLFDDGEEETTTISILDNLELEYYCILHELSAVMSSNPELKIVK